MNTRPSISSQDFLELMKNNNVQVIDVRGPEEFEQGHIFGSSNIPVDDLSQKHQALTNRKLIVAYCGKGGGRSERAAQILNENGKQTLWLEGGYSAWLTFKPNSDLQNKPMIFHQLYEKESSSYTYLLADPSTRDAIIIDPVLETVDRDLKLIKELDLKLLYILETHVHADHITGSSKIKERTGAKSVVSKKAGVCCADVELVENQEIKFGQYTLKVLETPGHTNESLSFLCDGMVFTGDSLMIHSAGRTDFQNGSPEDLFDSIQGKLFILNDEVKVYPAHDYNGISYSTIGFEKKFNSRIGNNKSKEEFCKIMRELKLADPKKIKEAVPANMACGKIS